MPILYQKNENGFAAVDPAKPETMPEIEKGMTVYDPSSNGVLSQYLIKVGDEIRLYDIRKLGNVFSLVDQYKQYDAKAKTWTDVQNPQRLQSAPKPFELLSQEEEKKLKKYYLSQRFTQKLKEKIQSLLNGLDEKWRAFPELKSVHDHVAKNYMDHVRQELTKLAETKNFSLQSCEDFLKKHWETIKGTALCYTALPDHPATLALCDIAAQLADDINHLVLDVQENADAKNKVSAIVLLMPGVVTESQFPGSFPNLDDIKIPELLKTHILNNDHHYLLPVRLLANRIDLSAANARDVVRSSDDDGAAAPAAAASDIAARNTYPHIAITHDFTKIYNPYDDEYKNVLSDNELRRLALHNSYTQALVDAQRAYTQIANDQSTLLGQLNLLINQLQGAGAHGGRGEQKIAASGAFPAINAFNDYYEKLTKEQKADMPEAVRLQIDKLMKLASAKQQDYQIIILQGKGLDKIEPGTLYLTKKPDGFYYSIKTHKNEDIKDRILPCAIMPANANYSNHYKDAILTYLAEQHHIPESKQFFISQEHLIETCVGSHSESLKSLVSQPASQEKLSAISLSKENKESELTRVAEIYFTNQTTLARTDQPFNHGRDQFGISKKILDLLTIVAKDLIKNDADLTRFMLLEESEIKELCEIKEIKSQIMGTVGEFENWALFFTNNAPEKIQIILHALKDEFCKTIVTKTSELSSLLSPLTAEKCRAICIALKDKLPGMIKNADDFRLVLRQLDPDQCAAVCAAFKDYLPNCIKYNCIKNYYDFTDVLSVLAPNQCAAVCAALKDYLPDIIKNANDFGLVLSRLHPDRCAALKDYLPDIIKNANDFELVLKQLDSYQRTAVCAALKDKLPGMIKNASDFRLVLRQLDPDQCAAVCAALKDYLPGIIGNANDFGRLLIWLGPDQCTAVCVALKDQLPSIIKSGEDFKKVLDELLFRGNETAVCAALKDQLLGIIKNSNNFRRVLWEFEPYQRTAIYEAIKDKLPDFITIVGDFSDVLSVLTPNQCAAVCAALKDYLPGIIRNANDFGLALKELAPNQCAAVCAALKDYLPGIIRNANDFGLILKHLDQDEQIVVYEALKDQLPDVIKCKADFALLLTDLSIEQYIKTLKILLLKKENSGPYFEMDLWKKLEGNLLYAKLATQIIDQLHATFYSLFDNPQKHQPPLNSTEQKNFDNNRGEALKFIKEIILYILKDAEADDRQIDRDAFSKAKAILSLHRNLPLVSFFGSRGSPESLSDPAFLKHQASFEQKDAKKPQMK